MAPAPSKGIAASKKMLEALSAAFPDMTIAIHGIWGIEDFVIQDTTFTGTQKGALELGPGMTIPPTNRPVELHAVDVIQMRDGKAIRGWRFGDSLEMAKPLGLAQKK